MTRLLGFVWALCMGTQIFAQSGRALPFTIELEQITFRNVPALHSVAWAHAEGKWLIVCGRTNGLHGFNPATGFPTNAANDKIWVVNPETQEVWAANLSTLANALADPLRSTNPQFYQAGEYLYIVGGYGRDSAQDRFVTFNTLTAIHIKNMMAAVMNNQNLRPHLRQIQDERLRVTGGEMRKIGNEAFLVFGHNFDGQYSRNQSPAFTQTYTNEVRKFQIQDDGVNLSLTNYSAFADPTPEEFHRRDLNVAPLVRPNGTFALAAYGGVFRRNIDLPFLHPIYIDGNGARVDSSYEQLMSHYTCANVGVYDAARQTMHTTFFGGISLHYFDEGSGTMREDDLVPFIDDVTTLTLEAQGRSDETIHDIRLPALLGSNAVFVLDEHVPAYENEVIRLNDIATRTFIGYIWGGIKATIPNFTPSSASDIVLKVYLTPNATQSVAAPPREKGYELSQAYPNPALSRSQINLRLTRTQRVTVEVIDLLGQQLALLHEGILSAGQTQSFTYKAHNPVRGQIFYRIVGEDFAVTRKVLVLP